jgi:hypothetical protein
MTASRPSPPDTGPISNESEDPGLWLWHGEAPAAGEAPPLAPPRSHLKRTAHHLGSAAQRAKWMVAPNAFTVIWLAVIGLTAWAMLHLLPAGEPMPRNIPVAASQPVSSPTAVRPAPPPAAVTPVQLDPVPAPPALTAQTVEQSTERKAVKSRAAHRSRLVKRMHASFVHAWAWEPCRYNCDNWTVPMTWHGGGY